MTSIPVVLFAYARPDHLARTLECLRENRVPLIHAFSDGPGTPDSAGSVAQVRRMLREIDWCEVILTERETNLGLGRSILSGVTEVLQSHDAVIVFEDDLICVPGTYQYLSAALEHYRDDSRVMSVTGWTHPLVTPSDVSDAPYFDGRAECWVWGTWAHAWDGMDVDARTLMERCRAEGLDVYRYGADLVAMADAELARNIWAVRLLYLHILRRKLCLRPPWSMVEHIGFGVSATNAREESWLGNPQLGPCPPVPVRWPPAIENSQCAPLHRAVSGGKPESFTRVTRFIRRVRSRIGRPIGSPSPAQQGGLAGDYSTWSEAASASMGYDASAILERTINAVRKVRDGDAAYERDSVLFDEIQYAWPVLSALMWVAARDAGRLDVLDIGGSLGSSYFQNRRFLSAIRSVRWNVVEQPGHVDAGRANFGGGPLHFYHTVEACLAEARPNVVLLSSVLQYLERPHELLEKINSLPINHLIIDRTSFWDRGADRLTVQTVPPSIYPASYPIWVFSRQNFMRRLESTWLAIAEFDTVDALPNSIGAYWRGMILERRAYGDD